EAEAGTSTFVVAADAAAERLGVTREAHNGMAETFCRHAIDEVDHAVLEAADVEPVDDLCDQRSCGGAHDPHASNAKPALTQSACAVTKASSRSASRPSTGVDNA